VWFAQAFSQLRSALEALIADTSAPAFSFDRAGGVQDDGSLWHAAAMAVLGAPRVTISSTAQSMAGFMGLAPIVVMWRAARKARGSNSSPVASQPSASRQQRVALEPVAMEQIRERFRNLNTQQWKVTAPIDDGKLRQPLLAVSEIRRAVVREWNETDCEELEIECTDKANALLEQVGIDIHVTLM
jgi:hypothetical protein